MIKIPEQIKTIMLTLETVGHRTYVVGGAVRDSLLGLCPKDWDLCTAATPVEIETALCGVVPVTTVDYAYGCVVVATSEGLVEITTFRKDKNHNGHACEVEFVHTIEEDLSRRDFDVNAIAVDVWGNVVDPYGGIESLGFSAFFFIGDVGTKLREDPLRLLRAIRMREDLGLECWEGTNLKECAFLVSKLTHFRVSQELERAVMSHNAHGILYAWEQLGVMERLFPDVHLLSNVASTNPQHIYPVLEHTLYAVSYGVPDLAVRLALLFHDTGKADSTTIDGAGVSHFYGHEVHSEQKARQALGMMFPDIIDEVCTLVKLHHRVILPTRKSVKRLMNVAGPFFEKVMQVKLADDLAKDVCHTDVARRIDDHREIMLLYRDILEKEEAFNVCDLAINGSAVIRLGVEQGPDVGKVLDMLLEAVFEFPHLNNLEDLGRLVAEWMEEHSDE